MAPAASAPPKSITISPPAGSTASIAIRRKIAGSPCCATQFVRCVVMRRTGWPHPAGRYLNACDPITWRSGCPGVPEAKRTPERGKAGDDRQRFHPRGDQGPASRCVLGTVSREGREGGEAGHRDQQRCAREPGARDRQKDVE